MNEAKLRQLEKRLKLRVKTGCETCRVRRIKCDETKPACTRCTSTGRTCEGYKHVDKWKDGSPAAAASYRNSSFLVVPQKAMQFVISRSPSQSFSPDSRETRSFQFFQTRTLPGWIEFFDSELWSRTVLQMSHSEPAIKHGLLALSTMHERFETTAPAISASTNDFAFLQYMQAVKHSNKLLAAQAGNVNIEKILIACIIFTCYENLSGNYLAANMHLRNGMRILNQHKNDLSLQQNASQEWIGHVLYRFDLQAMTFSETHSPYHYSLTSPPDCPQIHKTYTRNSLARDDMVGLMRCVLWLSGVVDVDPQAAKHPIWLQAYSQLRKSIEEWDDAFANYQQNLSEHEQRDPKVFTGDTLLKMYSIMTSVMATAGAGLETEMAWDAFVDSFKTIVDLAENLPILRPDSSPSSFSSSPSSPSPDPRPSQSAESHPIAPKPRRIPSSAPPGASTIVFRADPGPPVGVSHQAQSSTNVNSVSQRTHTSFSPSFELSPIVPLFVTACRCRDPVVRRRAIALLLTCRRREGVWDSLGAGIIALNWAKREEG
ncbi:uncharacterized protein K460DRAFT_241906, partial [Cucurbitaria berberidis CBS 394.84]